MKRMLTDRLTAFTSCVHDRAWWYGLALSAAVGVFGMLVAGFSWAQRLGLSALTLAIVLGMVVGNTFFPAMAARTGAGVDFSKNRLLRIGIILYGFRITFQQITAIGWAGIIIDALVVGMTFTLAMWVGTRVLKMDRQMSMLIGSGASICGAAAVMATEPVVKAPPHKVAVAVATVVVFGTLGMVIYPLLYPYLGLSEAGFGLYAGSTIHEVAQVVVAGRSVGETAADMAVIEKMVRVMMLAPFLMILSALLPVLGRGTSEVRPVEANPGQAIGKKASIVIPWFALLFIAASAVNSLSILPESIVSVLVQADNLLLATAMAALGLRTHASAIRQAGSKPLFLAAILFVFLIVGGYAINRVVIQGLAG
ncbi:MAG: hypothetical protein H6R01_857 [Burkholderiaceae bacterium]|nr:hypothetical protein [Burkholderiaceae bacterium]